MVNKAVLSGVKSAGGGDRGHGLLVQGATGVGKTTGTFKTLAAFRDEGLPLQQAIDPPTPDGETPPPRVVVYLAPTRELANESALAAEECGLRTSVAPARLDCDADSTPVCAFHKETKDLYDHGLGHLAPGLCQTTDAKSGETVECPMKATCAFQASMQRLRDEVEQGTIDLVITTHGRAMVHLPNGVRPWLTIIDENIDSAFPVTHSLRLDHLRQPLPGSEAAIDQKSLEYRRTILDALLSTLNADTRTVPKAFLDGLANDEGIAQLEAIREAFSTILGEGLTVTPGMSPGAIQALCKKHRARGPVRDEAILWQTIAEAAKRLRETPEARDERIRVRERDDSDGIQVKELRICRRRSACWTLRDSALIALDGTGSADLLTACFPKHAWETLSVTVETPQLRCIALPETTMSTTRLVYEPTAAAERRQVHREIEALSRKHRHVVVFATKAVLKAFKDADHWSEPKNVELVNFGNQRGLNRFEKADAFYLLGRSHLAPGDIEDQARAYFGDASTDRPEQSLAFGERKSEAVRFHLADGRVYTKSMDLYPRGGHRCVYEQTTVAGLIQAIGRARGATRDNLATVYVRTVVELPILWHAIMTGKELIGERTELADAFERFGGVLPLAPKLLEARSKEIFGKFKAESAIRKKLSRLGLQSSSEVLTPACLFVSDAPALVEVHLAGRPSQKPRFLVDARQPEEQTRVACEAFCRVPGYPEYKVDSIHYLDIHQAIDADPVAAADARPPAPAAPPDAAGHHARDVSPGIRQGTPSRTHTRRRKPPRLAPKGLQALAARGARTIADIPEGSIDPLNISEPSAPRPPSLPSDL